MELDSVLKAMSRSAAPTSEPAPKEVSAPSETTSDNDPEDIADDTGEDIAASPAAEDDEPKKSSHVPYSAFEKERKRRKAALEQAKALEVKLAAYEQQKQQAAAPPQETEPELKPEDFWNDPAEYTRRVEERVEKRNQKLRSDVTWQVSLFQAKQMHLDFDEVTKDFMELAQKNPMYAEQMRAHPHPAEYAYQTGQQYRQARAMSEIGDPEEYRKKLREEVRAELEKERETSEDAEKAKRLIETVKNAPTSLADKRGAGVRKPPPYQRKTLDQIFDKSRFEKRAR